MNNFYQALEQGYPPEEILKYIKKAIPQFAEPIRKATSAGYTIQQILGFLSKNFDKENRKGMSESEIHAANRRSDAERTKYGLKMAAGAVAAPIAGLAARSALSRALPSSLQSLNQNRPQTNPLNSQALSQTNPDANYPSGTASASTLEMPQGQTQLQPSQQPPNVNAGNIPQQPNIPQAKTSITDILSKNKGFIDQIEKLKASGNGSEEIAAYFKKFNPSQTTKLEKEAGKPIEEVISEYLGQQVIPKNTENLDTSQQPVEKPEEIAHVALPNETPYQVHKRLKIGYAEAARLIEERDKEKPQELNGLQLQNPQQTTQEDLPVITEKEKAVQHNPERQERPKIGIKNGKLFDIQEKTNRTVFGKEERPIEGKQKSLKDLTYEDMYKDASLEDRKTFKIIDEAVHKAAKNIVEGKDFTELLPLRKGELYGQENKKGIALSTAEDVLKHLAGLPSKYQLLDKEEQEDAFNTFQGLTPNLIWNMLSLTDPRIQKIAPRPLSPKGAKEGKKEYTSTDFRRMLAHGVLDFIDKHEKFGEKARYIVPVVNMIEIFKERKNDMQKRLSGEIQSMTDEDLNELLVSVDEDLIRKIR